MAEPARRQPPVGIASTLKVVPQGDREVVITREFAAPCAMVFACWTKPELMRRWLLGPEGWTMITCTVDLRVGGAYRFEWRKDGAFLGMGGEYREIAAPERIVCTELFDEFQAAGPSISTVVLTERGDRTIVTNTIRYPNPEVREGMVASGMAVGLDAGYRRLDAILAEG